MLPQTSSKPVHNTTYNFVCAVVANTSPILFYLSSWWSCAGAVQWFVSMSIFQIYYRSPWSIRLNRSRRAFGDEISRSHDSNGQLYASWDKAPDGPVLLGAVILLQIDLMIFWRGSYTRCRHGEIDPWYMFLTTPKLIVRPLLRVDTRSEDPRTTLPPIWGFPAAVDTHPPALEDRKRHNDKLGAQLISSMTV